jgi:hypothetical protein
MPASPASATRDLDPKIERAEVIMAREAGRTFAGSGPCRDRTCDLGIKSPLLYQLS